MVCRRVRRRGQALVVAILALTVLTAGAIALSAAARLELRAARRGVSAVGREAALRGAVNRGLALLDAARADPAELRSTLRRYHALQWTPLVPQTDPDSPTVEVAVQILDASARINLNTASEAQLRQLPDISSDTVSAILGWRDERSRDDYGKSARPYEPKRRPFDTLEELLLVRDVDPALFFGAPGARETVALRRPPLSEWLTTLSGENNTDAEGNPRVDVNSATAEELLEAANRNGQIVTSEQAQNLVQKRRQRETSSSSRGGGSKPAFRSVNEALREAGVEEKHWGPVLDAWTVDRRTFLPARINVNTAPPAVLQAVGGMNEETARKIVEQRAEKPGGLAWSDLLDLAASGGQPAANPPPAGGGEGTPVLPPANGGSLSPDQIERLFCVRSSVYFVRCLVRVAGSGRTDAAMAMVYCPSPEEPAKVVQWRQPDRFPGWGAWYRPLGEEEEAVSGR